MQRNRGGQRKWREKEKEKKEKKKKKKFKTEDIIDKGQREGGERVPLPSPRPNPLPFFFLFFLHPYFALKNMYRTHSATYLLLLADAGRLTQHYVRCRQSQIGSEMSNSRQRLARRLMNCVLR